MELSASAAFGCGSSHLTGLAGLSLLDKRRDNEQFSSLSLEVFRDMG